MQGNRMNRHRRLPACNNRFMNFFQRRKFLKKVNSLELTPLRLLGHTAGEGAKVSVLLPRYRGTLFGPVLQSRTNRKYIQIRLDDFGSATWLMIDGRATVGEICSNLIQQFGESLTAPEEMEERVAKFMFVLYDQRYITFRELQDPAPQ
jgi:hypothetical protein